jgi:DNA-binding NarL/FixJ family response regulator
LWNGSSQHRNPLPSCPESSGHIRLTESELRVARLAARGLTNRQIGEQLFLSPHTVSSHLRHTFTKLEISSRVQLARMATQHDPTRT